MGDRIILAPLRGVTVRSYRSCIQRHFGGFDMAVSPFLTTVAGQRIKATHLEDVRPERNTDMPVVPQVIGKDPAEFRTILQALRDMGYTRVDLNSGCPYPMITRKGRGSGLLKDADNLRRMLDAGCDTMGEGGLSVKVRLGLDKPDLLPARMDVFNSYPLAELTIHARTAKQMYEGCVDVDAFGACLAMAKMPVVYNGDISSPADFNRLKARFPLVAGWMIGRGAIVDPILAARIRRGDTGEFAKFTPTDERAVVEFVRDYASAVRDELCGPAPFLGRMKEMCSYLCKGFADGDAMWARLKKASSYDDFMVVFH